MPGLFGVLALSPRTSDERLAAMARRMAESMATTSWLRTELWEGAGFAGGRVHLGVANPASQPQSSAASRPTLAGECACTPTSASSGCRRIPRRALRPAFPVDHWMTRRGLRPSELSAAMRDG